MSITFSRARSSVLALALGVALSLTACDGPAGTGDEPREAGATTATATATASPDPSTAPATAPPDASAQPTAARAEPRPASSAAPAANLPIPAVPAEADEESREGLEAFTSHWLSLLSYSYEANDLEPLRAVSDPACTFCADAETAMAQIYQLGWALGGATTLADFSTDFAPDAAGTYTAEITTTQAEIFYFSGEGWLGSSEASPNSPHTVTARYVDGAWQLIGYTAPPVTESPEG
ncbi:DUF6318 family protein [Arthrobacter bussei]|uniref:DUF6318 domain-containing protein n=1 Tax=Arthrobacter bussei TaxID=2594179 RepID=A0A7X1NQP5_9MICC|nr:DUF6318 family protein [Arthrobacter bussei]MPY11205.1 hypothetical protein [Arthrobacter bussei]